MSDSKSRCFLLEPPKRDVADCMDFGEIVYLFQYGENRPSIFSLEYQDELERRFQSMNFDPNEDYFVLTGFQISISVAIAVLTKMFKNFELLAFYTPTHSYTSINIGQQVQTREK